MALINSVPVRGFGWVCRDDDDLQELTGELAIPIGLHITRNSSQGNVFGCPVSGTNAGASIVSITQGGPTLWTGGAFGPEAGLVGIGALLLGSAAIVAWLRYRYRRAGVCEELAEPPVAAGGQ